MENFEEVDINALLSEEFVKPVTYAESAKVLLNLRDMMHLDRIGPIAMEIVGSTFICGEGKDSDILMLVSGEAFDKTITYFVEKHGYAIGGSGENEDGWCSVKSGTINVIICKDYDFYEKWVAAAHVCRYVRDLIPGFDGNRQIRVDIHQFVCDGRQMPSPSIGST